jgi:iron(III) transport system ATP-binding protein
MNSFIDIKNLSLKYDNQTALSGVNLQIKEGDLVCILGPSGCGKTSLLRSIAGFENPSEGKISVGKKEVFSTGNSIAVEKRDVGFVFQDLALFPHLNVTDNVGFGLSSLRKDEKSAKVIDLLTTVGLSEYGERFPHELSGGQKQRVALARSVAPTPNVILLDEPFSSLDQELSESMAREIRSILKKFGLTAIMVTHNQHEALSFADKVAVMLDGKIAHYSSPSEVYSRPNTLEVAEFVGDGFSLEGDLKNDKIETQLGDLVLAESKKVDVSDLSKGSFKVFLRPEALEIASPRNSSEPGFEVSVEHVRFRGSYSVVQGLGEGNTSILVRCHTQVPQVGEKIKVKFTADAEYRLFSIKS